MTLVKPLLWMLALLFAVVGTVAAQTDLAAVMQVNSPGVEVQRANTAQWIPVQVEAIVGVGDQIRTDATGQAKITFFADGVETTIEANSTYRIDAFNGNDETFTLSVTLLAGQTQQRLNRVLDSGSSYDVNTPGVSLVARGTEFDVRVEADGRGAMLVREGTVSAQSEASSADVPAEFGIRVTADGAQSDVVRADNFEVLDNALDGCTVQVDVLDDTRLNVRLGASTDFPRVGTIDPTEISLFYGVSESGGWYRIQFRGGFGWVLSSTPELSSGCMLRGFPVGYGPEDATVYEFLGDPISADELSNLPAPVTEETD
jgi:hypothetical protein